MGRSIIPQWWETKLINEDNTSIISMINSKTVDNNPLKLEDDIELYKFLVMESDSFGFLYDKNAPEATVVDLTT